MDNPLKNTVTDSRDLIEYREHLEQEILDEYISWVENHNEHCEEGEELEIPYSFEDIEFIDEEAFTMTCEDTLEEYEDIKSFCEQLEDYGDFQYGESIISEHYFTEAMQELCEDIGDVKDLPAYISNNIDWDAVADDLKADYTEETYKGVTYFMRA